MSDRLNELGENVVEMVELVNKLGLNADDLAFSQTFEMFKDIVNYLKLVENKSLFVNRVIQGEINDKLKKLWEYVKLAEQRDYYDADLNLVIQERKRLFGENPEEDGTVIENFELQDREKFLRKKVLDVDSEMRIYEN